MAFYIWLLWLRVIFSRFIHAVTCIILHSFLWLHNILLCGYATLCLSTHPWMNIWVVSTCWLLWLVLLWEFIHKLLFENPFSVSVRIHPGAEFLSHVMILISTWWEKAKLFSLYPHHLQPGNIMWVFRFLHILASTCRFLCFWGWRSSWVLSSTVFCHVWCTFWGP